MGRATAIAAAVNAGTSARSAVEQSLAACQADTRNAVIRVHRERAVAAADRVDARVRAGERLALAGVPVALKDNLCVDGLPATCCSRVLAGYVAPYTATAVARLEAAGAVIVAQCNMDEFAFGSSNETSCYGPVQNPHDPARIPGGSSSGSACAVATGICPAALGTDTAGSGRVPAAFTNIVGLKPTRGWLPTRGVVPACRSLDCVSVFALTVEDAWAVLTAAAGWDAEDPQSRRAETPALPSGRLRIGIPADSELEVCDPAWLACYRSSLEALRGLGHDLVAIDYAPFRTAAGLLYGGAFVAERTAAVGAFLAGDPAGLDPTVAAIIRGGAGLTASSAFAGFAELARLRRLADAQWERMDLLALPTAPCHPTLAEVAADPVGANARLGRFTNFANLLDTCAAAVPAGFTAGGLPTGITLFAPAWHDLLAARTGAALQDALGLPLGAGQGRLDRPQAIAGDPGTIEIAVFGAHLSGQPLNRELLALGGRLAGAVSTSPRYRLSALRTTPPKPGLVRTSAGGAAIAGEVWRLPVAGFGRFVAAIPPPLAIGSVELADGRWVKGFLAEPEALAAGEDITAWGGWVAWLAGRRPG